MSEFPKLNSEILYKRLLEFAKNCLELTNGFPKTIGNIEYSRQLIRSSSSVGANYIEAIEGFSRKEFIHRLKISRKETKESVHWLVLIQNSNKELKVKRACDQLIGEGRELVRIFASSINTAVRNSEIHKIIQ